MTTQTTPLEIRRTDPKAFRVTTKGGAPVFAVDTLTLAAALSGRFSAERFVAYRNGDAVEFSDPIRIDPSDSGLIIEGREEGEAGPKLRILTTGIGFGPGGSNFPDTYWSRRSASAWETPDQVYLTWSGAALIGELTGNTRFRLLTNPPRFDVIGSVPGSVLRGLIDAEANPRMQLTHDRLEFGAGGASALDSFFRYGGLGFIFGPDNFVSLEETSVGGVSWDITKVGEAHARFVLTDNEFSWGGGAAVQDIKLYRGAADRLDLATGDSFRIVSGNLEFGTDVTLTRGAANLLATADAFEIGLHLAMVEQGGDPANVANQALLYSKDDGGVTKLYYRMSDGTVVGPIVLHARYTDAEAVLAIEAETTLEFDAATVISTVAGNLTLSPLNHIIMNPQGGFKIIFQKHAKMNDTIRLVFGTGDDYWWYYDNANARIALKSSDSDGIGGDADIIRIEDGGMVVDFMGGITIGGNDEHAGYSEYTEIAAPANPAANKMRAYAKDVGGVTGLAFKDSAGVETVLVARTRRMPMTTTRLITDRLRWPDGSTQKIIFAVRMPTDWVVGTDVTLNVSMRPRANGTAVMRSYITAWATGETEIENNIENGANINFAGTNDVIVTTTRTIAAAGLQASDAIYWQVDRLGGDGGDTMGGNLDAYYGAWLEYTAFF